MRITQIVTIRYQICFKAKNTKFDFGWGSAPDPAGATYSAAPDPLAAFKGPTSRGRDAGEGKGREGQGEGRGRGMRGSPALLISPRM